MMEHEPRRKAEEFVKIHRETVVPPDDVNLGEDLLLRRKIRKSVEISSELEPRLKKLFDGVPISKHFRQHLTEEMIKVAGLEFTRWDEDFQGSLLKELYGISLSDNQFGIFDPAHAFEVEFQYFHRVRDMLEWQEKSGLSGGVSWREWRKDLFRRLEEKGTNNV